VLLLGLQKSSSVIYIRLTGFYSLSMKEEYTWSHDEIRDIPVGTLVRFVDAPPRFKGEAPRGPGSNLLNTVGIILSDGAPDAHGWGGVFSIHSNEHGERIQFYGDFLEVIE